MSRKEVTKKESDKKAQNVKSVDQLKALVWKEAKALYRKEQHSIVQLLAYMEQLDKQGALKEKEK